MARPVDYRKSRGNKGVHTEDEQVPAGKKDQGRQPHLVDPERPASTAGRQVGQGKHAAGHAGQRSGRKKSK